MIMAAPAIPAAFTSSNSCLEPAFLMVVALAIGRIATFMALHRAMCGNSDNSGDYLSCSVDAA
jgi:hypothetical protein